MVPAPLGRLHGYSTLQFRAVLHVHTHSWSLQKHAMACIGDGFHLRVPGMPGSSNCEMIAYVEATHEQQRGMSRMSPPTWRQKHSGQALAYALCGL